MWTVLVRSRCAGRLGRFARLALFVRNFGGGCTNGEKVLKSSGTGDFVGNFGTSGKGLVANNKLETIKNLLGSSFDGLSKKIGGKSVESPFSILNQLGDDEVNLLMTRFKNKVYQEVETSKIDFIDANSWKLVDFINPRLNNLSAIVYLIINDSIPRNFGTFYNLSTSNEILTSILIKLFHKEYLQYKVETIKSNESLLDFSNPAEWFPEARKMKRKIIMHVGPTNSGKTYNSLQKLSKAKSGYYAGPLRLLAREIYERFNKEGIRCNLITGEEVVPSIDEFGKVSEISSGTIEMIPLSKKMDICIIDEIQMIADTTRGNAWTSALLGVQAKEIHLCGEASAVPIVKKICEITGDEIEIKHFERLGKLTVEKNTVKSLKSLKKGDCLITFSKRTIIDLKCRIERETKFKVAVIYGALPPEIRSEQASGFNNGEYDVLVASDAIGMGLNLKINRIVFDKVLKFDGKKFNLLTASQTKQIGGRAGRYSKVHGESEGFVTAMRRDDLKFITRMMKKPIPDIEKAIIWPTDIVWKHYMTKFEKGTPFFQILLQFVKDIKNSNLSFYEINEIDARAEILKIFMEEDLYKRTTVQDQLTLSLAPVNLDISATVKQIAIKLFKNVADCTSKTIFDFDFLQPDIIKNSSRVTAQPLQVILTLQKLEDMHKIVLLFLWLSQRWPTLFIDKESAFDMKSLIEKRITQELSNLRRINKLN